MIKQFIVAITLLLCVSAFADQKKVAFQGTPTLPAEQRPSVYVEPAVLTEVFDQALPKLNIGVVASDADFAAGVQKAADVWGLNVDLFRKTDPAQRLETARMLVKNGVPVLIVDSVPGDDWSSLKEEAAAAGTVIQTYAAQSVRTTDRFQHGFNALKAARAVVLTNIPKYDQLLPIAFPISPLPDSFFQPSKFPYPQPLVRVERTAESVSASAHAHTSCNMVAQTGNMLHRTSSIDANLFLMGMEGGNLSLKALPGAVDPQKVSAVMTSWVMAVRGAGSAERDILVENDGIDTSVFKPAIHAPEELDMALTKWARAGIIRGHKRVNDEDVLLKEWHGKDRLVRAGMFLVASDRQIRGPEIVEGVDMTGRLAFDFFSTQAFVQQFVEVAPAGATFEWREPKGGTLTAGGATVGATVGSPLKMLLRKVEQPKPDFQPYVFSIEGGFFVVTPEQPVSEKQWNARVRRVDIDLRGPLTSDQTITIALEGQSDVILRRTVLNFTELDRALDYLRTLGFIQDWTYDGSRGRGLNANVVFQQFLGKHRKFMSSLATWPNEERPLFPIVRFYVDGMQRLNFTFVSTEGWRQEFVEVPLRIPPVPRDVALYTGLSTLR